MSKQKNKNNEIIVEKIKFYEKIKIFFLNKQLRLILATIFCALSLCLFIAYCSYFFTGKEDYSIVNLPSEEQEKMMDQISNSLGLPGAQISHLLISRTFGIFSLCIINIIFNLALLFLPIKQDKIRIPHARLFICNLFVLLWGSITIAFIQDIVNADIFLILGGQYGMNIASFLRTYLKDIGTIIVLTAILIIFLISIDKNFTAHIGKIFNKLKFNRTKQNEIQELNVNKNIDKEPNTSNNINAIDEEIHLENENDLISITIEKNQHEDNSIIQHKEDTLTKKDEQEINNEHPTQKIDINAPVSVETVEKNTTAEDLLNTLGPYDPRKDLEFYQFPPLDLLKTYDNETSPVINRDEQQNNANRIVTSLRNYGVEIESIKITVGPTVTLYEVVPKAGVKIAKIQALEADIMLSLSAVGIRIIAPMPGKGTVGIEVPNENPQVVSMHSVIASKKFQEEKKMRLPIAIGRTITNDVFMFDLAKTPHLLVAGATGQGKSVGLNAIITSLLYKKHPSELKLVLVDPKMVEFSIYKPLIKHYLAAMPDQDARDIIITDCQKVINTLNSLVIEMEDRYTLLADTNCRNLEDYNDKFIHRQLDPTKDIENIVTHKFVNHRFMPYIVIVIDEYGDFIMQAGKEVERPIQRLAQKARAVGMHMILATQRPDVKIITGTIKANIPTRIAFRTQSVVDSRTVLDAKGADQLIGKGDMLFSGNGNLTRIQCAFVDTPEVEALVEHINHQQGFTNFYLLPEYVPEGENDKDNKDVDIKQLDELFAEVARYVVAKQEGSTSRLQRAFEIGYNRAGKLSDQLEATGIVGPNKGPKGRDVLIQDMESLERILEKLKIK